MHRLHRLVRLLVVPVALVALLAAAGPAQAAPGDWWQLGYTAAGVRYNPDETTIGPANVGRLVVGAEQVPAFGAGATFAHASGVAVAGGRAYVQVGDFESGSSALLAYDTGAFQSPPLWRQRSGCNNASPTVHLSIVLVGAIACRPSGDDGGVRAFDAATGRLLWYSQELGIGNGTEDASNVAVTGGVVYSIGLENGAWQLFARSVSNGALRWKRTLPGSGGLAVAGGRVVVANGTGLRAVDAATGAPRWSVAVAATGSPAVANGLVYAGLQQGIGAWRLSDGARRWRSGTIPYGSPSVSSGRVYASGLRSADDRLAVVVDQFRLGD